MSEESEDLGIVTSWEGTIHFDSNVNITLDTLRSMFDSSIYYTTDEGFHEKGEIYNLEAVFSRSRGIDIKFKARKKIIRVDINEYQNV